MSEAKAVDTARDRLVIGLDSSTQSTKTIAWDSRGRAVAEGRAPVPMSNPGPGRYEQDPVDWWRSACAALRECTAGIEPARIDGLAISNQRETLGCFDADGHSLRPAILWLDGRTGEQIRGLSERFGAERIHRITGRVPDLTSALYRFAWLAEHEPDTFAATRTFADVQATLVQRLCGGPWRTGRASADPLGLVDMASMTWSDEILAAIGVGADRLPGLVDSGRRLGEVSGEAARATGLAPGTPVFAGGGDGQLAGLGVGCTRPGRAYVNLGTAVVAGVWSADYRHDRGCRTELAANGGYILETCLRSGAFLVDWFVDRFASDGASDGATDGATNGATFARLDAEAAALPIGSEGLLLQPFFEGDMDPHWDPDARGVLLGLATRHGEAHLYRAILEGITLYLVAGLADIERASGRRIEELVVIGGGSRSALWCRMLADAVGRPVRTGATAEASALGAGILAAAGAGWYTNIDAAADAMTGSTDEALVPDVARHARYRELLAIHRDLYAATRELNHRMVAFAAGQDPT